ncbi:MnuA family membrane nuclease [Mycoplasma sp. E35C]|uniref:MnuA family membrane nuclease n=1 Tax=Mycoplasma sp. E35C TaxID=2801918 RepID=UPI001CA42030|nr:endonuclease/exonuclease/phosphatase family protein [Mycoplasma sp. E35C]QZX49158.1 nuclease [Mycoplasma sp. E35C]
MSRPKQTTQKNNKKLVLAIILLVLIIVIGIGGYFVYTRYFAKNKTQTDPSHNHLDLIDPNDPNQNNQPVVNQNTYKKVGDLRILAWNVLNFGHKASLDSNKFINISKTIKLSNADVVGLVEINYNDQQIVENLTNSLGSSWSYTFSGENYNSKFPNSKESVAILYKKDIVEPLQTGSINPNNIYTRPLWYTKFKTKQDNYEFISMFGHFDAPGANKNNDETKGPNNQGSQEILEAKTVSTIFKELKEKYPETDIVGYADTNIKEENNNLFDSSEYQLNYIDFNDNKEKYKTSLGTKNNYSNTYDKWFVYDAKNSNILRKSEIPYKIDIINAFRDKIWDREQSLNGWKASHPNATKLPTDFQIIRNVSDHAPIILDINYKTQNTVDN